MPAQGYPTPPLVGGNSVRNPILEGYVFQSGIHKPEHSSILTYKYPQYYLTSLMDRIGASEPTAQSTFSWSVLDRTRESGTASSVTGVPGTSATFEITEFDYSATDLGGLVVGDVIRTESGAILRVTATAVSTVLSNKQKVTVAKPDGASIAATELASAMVFGHAFNAFGEGSEAPNGRLFLPTEDFNVTTILRRSVQITGSEFTNRTMIGDGGAWYWVVEELTRKEFARDREALILTGIKYTTGVKVSRGILDWTVSEGVNSGFAAGTGVVEEDILEHIRKLRVEGGSAEYLVLCGSKLYKSVQKAMKDYFVGGGVNLGSFDSNSVGLNVRKYDFMGISANFVLYEMFEDKKIFPFAGTNTALKADFSWFSLWLDLGTESAGQKLIKLKYKALGGESRKFIQTVERGMMNPNGANDGFVSSGFDGFKVHMLSEIGIEVRNANRFGILRATS